MITTKQIESAIETLENRLEDIDLTYTFQVYLQDHTWSIDSFKDEDGHETVFSECSGMYDEELLPFIEGELFDNIRARNDTPSIEQMVRNVKIREQNELIYAVHKYGKEDSDNIIYDFHGILPCIAAYFNDDPHDVVVHSVEVNHEHGNITLIVHLKEDDWNEYRINADEVFAGHLEFVTSSIH